MLKFNSLVMMLLALTFQTNLYASDSGPTQEEMDAWFNDDAEFRIAEVNEGELSFLSGVKNNTAHKAKANNKITILPTSKADGWVSMNQCHRGLDAVPLAQLIFPEYTLRNLRVTKQRGIAEARVEAKSIQLEDISRGAELCVAMQVKALKKNKQGQYVLSNGPYQRRFLDGYYPMKLTLKIDYSQSGLIPVGVVPATQTGMSVIDENQQMQIKAYFEGVLRTKVSFEMNKSLTLM